MFDAYNLLRRQKADRRGRISEAIRDQARAAIVFTSAGIDASLRTLLRDSLPTLLQTEGKARGAFIGHLYMERLSGTVTDATKAAVVALDARDKLIDLYVGDVAGSSIQGSDDLQAVRNALGLQKSVLLDDEMLRSHQNFFTARHQVVHELDIIDASGRGTRGRQHRDIPEVAEQCRLLLQVVYWYIQETTHELRVAKKTFDAS